MDKKDDHNAITAAETEFVIKGRCMDALRMVFQAMPWGKEIDMPNGEVVVIEPVEYVTQSDYLEGPHFTLSVTEHPDRKWSRQFGCVCKGWTASTVRPMKKG